MPENKNALSVLLKNPVMGLLILLLAGGGGTAAGSILSGRDSDLSVKFQMLQVKIEVLQTVVENLSNDLGELKGELRDLTKLLRDVHLNKHAAYAASTKRGYYDFVLDLRKKRSRQSLSSLRASGMYGMP